MRNCAFIAAVIAFVSLAWVPALAQTADYSKAEEQVTKLGHQMYVVRGADYSSTVAVGKDGIIVVDSQPAALFDKLKSTIADLSPLPVKYVINTHYHGFVTGGNAGFHREGATIVAYITVLDRMQHPHPTPNGPGAPAAADALPTLTYSGAGTIVKVGGVTAQLVHLPQPAHTDADTIVLWKAANVISAGDVLSTETYPDIDVSAGSIDGMIAAADYIIDHANTTTKIVPVHGPVTDKAGMVAYRKMLVTVRDRVAEAKKAFESEDEVVTSTTLFADLDAQWAVPGLKVQRFPGMVYETMKLQRTGLPQWPYPQMPPKGSPAPAPDNGELHHLPGSTKAFTMEEIEGVGTVDWFPETHPKAPAAVIDGKPGAYRSCGLCHEINGYGKPDAQSLNDLPVAYMQQQVEDMKNDLRHASVVESSMGAFVMSRVAKDVPEADMKEALDYFRSIGAAKWIRVVEAGTVPKTMPGEHSLLALDPSGGTEPIGNRILELPENYDRTLLRDPTSGFVVYVPPGSLKKGEALVKTGAGGRTIACTTCHGTDLRGMGNTIPPIAGRSPTTTGRQLYDFKTGARHGKNSAMMKPAVEKLTDEDIVDISAYLASLPQ